MFVLLVTYFVFNPFEGFGGYANIVGIIIADIIFVGIILWNMNGENRNPYLKEEDRDRQISRLAKVIVLTSNIMVIFVSVDLILSATDSRGLIDVCMSFYFLVIAAISFKAYQFEDVDFEVYRDSSATS